MAAAKHRISTKFPQGLASSARRGPDSGFVSGDPASLLEN
jgi:hypothetical protein